jgi:hypothetical protein
MDLDHVPRRDSRRLMRPHAAAEELTIWARESVGVQKSCHLTHLIPVPEHFNQNSSEDLP